MSKYNEIEIQTAKNLLDHGYGWIARYADGDVGAFSKKPYKKDLYWFGDGKTLIVSGKLTPMYPNIKWTDNEPTFIDHIINPQILDDTERRYLSAVIRPFRDRVECIVKTTLGCERKKLHRLFGLHRQMHIRRR